MVISYRLGTEADFEKLKGFQAFQRVVGVWSGDVGNTEKDSLPIDELTLYAMAL